MNFDHHLFLIINGWAGHSAVLDKIGSFVGGDYFMYLLGLAVLLLWLKKTLRPNVYLAVISATVGYGLLTQILKRLVDRPRPYEVLPVHQLIIDTERGVSFPSGHATVYFALAFAFWGTKYFWPFFILAIIGSVGRVFVGVHYPADVLVGAVMGLISVWIVKRLFKNSILS